MLRRITYRTREQYRSLPPSYAEPTWQQAFGLVLEALLVCTVVAAIAAWGVLTWG